MTQIREDTDLARARIRIANDTFSAARRVTPREHRNDTRWQFFTLRDGIRSAFLIIQEHIHILNAVLQYAATPLDLVEKQLVLKAACNLQRDSSVVRRDTVIDRELALYLRLDR